MHSLGSKLSLLKVGDRIGRRAVVLADQKGAALRRISADLFSMKEARHSTLHDGRLAQWRTVQLLTSPGFDGKGHCERKLRHAGPFGLIENEQRAVRGDTPRAPARISRPGRGFAGQAEC